MPRVHDFPLYPGAESKRREEHARILHGALHGWGEAFHEETLFGSVELFDRLGGIRAVHAHGGFRKRETNERPHLLGHPPHGVHVGRVIERPDRDEPGARFEPGRGELSRGRVAEEGRGDEFFGGDAVAVAEQRRLDGRTHQRQIAAVHGRELAAQMVVSSLRHGGEGGENRGGGFVFGDGVGASLGRGERGFDGVVSRVSEGMQVLHVEDARGGGARGADAEGERLLGHESVEDDGVGGGGLERGFELGAAIGRDVVGANPRRLEDVGVLVGSRAREVVHAPSPRLEHAEQAGGAHARGRAARLGPKEADEHNRTRVVGGGGARGRATEARDGARRLKGAATRRRSTARRGRRERHAAKQRRRAHPHDSG